MALPDPILVRYTEEDAGYVSVRPVVQQTFRIAELADLVVSVAGKDTARVQQIFRIGTTVYHGYRYSWKGIAAETAEIEALLANFPDDDPTRPFDPAKATAVLLEIGGGAQRYIVELSREEASEKKLFARLSPWAVLMQWAAAQAVHYEKYSYACRADLFRITLPFGEAQQLLVSMREAAPHGLRRRWSTLHPPATATFLCPRSQG